MHVAEVISGSEGLAGVQWLLKGAEPQAALGGLMRQMLDRPDLLGDWRLVRAKYRTRHKLIAAFEACVHDPASGRARLRPIAVTWSSPDHSDPPAGDAEADIQAEAEHRGVSAPFRMLDAREPSWNLHVRVTPLDDRFPQLVRLSDPVYAGKALNGQGELSSVNCVRYRPHQRHILKYDSPAPGRGRTSFVKLYSGETGAVRAYADLGRIYEWVRSQDLGFSSMRPLALLAVDAAVVYEGAPGAPLSALVRALDPELPWLLERAGEALRILQAAPIAFVGGEECRDFAAQLAAVQRSGEHRIGLAPSADNALRRLLDRACRVEERISSVPSVFSHGDFKADHVYLAGGGMTIIDLDNRCLCDPGFDAGKFLADLHSLLAAHGTTAIERAQSHFLAGYAPSPERLLRVRLWETLMLAYQGFRRLLLSEAEGAWLQERIGIADAALGRIEARVGLG